MNNSKRKTDNNEYRINDEITGYSECRLIYADGEQIGMVSLNQAKEMSEEQGYDLVELSASSTPPVCRLMDYGKFKYDRDKKAKAQKKQSKQQTKEIKFHLNIDVGDYNTKIKHIKRFLDEGHRVKVTVMFRGREISHPELGTEIIERILEDCADVASVAQKPKLDGRNLIMVLSKN